MREQEQFVDELVDIVRQEQVDLVLMAGDVYDSVNPPAAAEELFYEACARLTEEGRKLVVISGNHDQPERVAAVSPLVARSGISLVGLPVYKPVRVFAGKAGEEAVIAALPYPSEARLNELLASGEDELELRSAYSSRVSQLMRELAGGFRPDTINLAMSHIYVLGGLESDSERPIQVGGAYTVDPSALDIGAQYTALGHLHRPQSVKGTGVMRYSGSPLAYSFSEAGQAKSVMLMDLKPGSKAEPREIFLRSGRPLVEWKCRGGIEEARSWIGENRDAAAFIDLEIHLTESMSMADIAWLRKTHEGIVHIRPVYPGRAVEDSLVVRSQMPVDQLFRKFYERQSGGAEAETELVELFMSLLGEESEEQASGEGEA